MIWENQSLRYLHQLWYFTVFSTQCYRHSAVSTHKVLRLHIHIFSFKCWVWINECFFAEPFNSADVVGVWGDSVSTSGSPLQSAPTISPHHPRSVPCCHQGHTRQGLNTLLQVPAQLHFLQVWIRGSWDRSLYQMKGEKIIFRYDSKENVSLSSRLFQIISVLAAKKIMFKL